MSENCSWTEGEKVCGKPITHFVVLRKLPDGTLITQESCLYHYCKFYGIDPIEEGKLMKKIKEKQL